MKSGSEVKRVPESNLTPEVALSIFRSMAGCKDYPFHVEGEKARAVVLIENCAGVSHARQTIAEFDDAEDCPTREAIRSAAKRLAEVCECGKAKWQHRDGVACKMFNTRTGSDEWIKGGDGGFSKFRDSIPMVEGVPWEVCLQAQSLKISIRPKSQTKAYDDEEAFPEACAAIRAGREPDYKLLEAQMRRLFPRMWRGSRSVGAGTVADRIADVDKKYAVESITPESQE